MLRWRTVSGDARSFLPPLAFQPGAAFAGRGVPVVTTLGVPRFGVYPGPPRGDPPGGMVAPLGGAGRGRGAARRGRAVRVRLLRRHRQGGPHPRLRRPLRRRVDRRRPPGGRPPGGAAERRRPGRHRRPRPGRGGSRGIARRPGSGGGRGHDEWRGPLPVAARRPGQHRMPGRTRPAGATGTRPGSSPSTSSRRAAGSAGPSPPAFRRRLGDVALVPFLPVAYLDPADTGEMRLVCRHGSLTRPRCSSPAWPPAEFGSSDPVGHGWGDGIRRSGPAGSGPAWWADTGRAAGASRGDQEESVSEPAKVMRIGSMIKQLLDEVRQAPLDEASRGRLREIYDTVDPGAGIGTVTRPAGGAGPDGLALRRPHHAE